MFSIGVISLSIIIIINMVVVWVLITQSWRTRVNRYFIMAVALVVLWAIGTLLLLAGSTPDLIAAGRVLFLVAPMYTILFLSLFAAVFPKSSGRSFTAVNIFLTLLTLVFSAFILTDPGRLIPTAVHQAGTVGFNTLGVDGFWYAMYSLYFNVAFLITFSEFYLHLRHTKGYQHKQLLYVFSGTFLAAMLSLITNLTLPVLGVSNLIWLGPTWTLFYVITVSVAIVKHQLFDVKLAAVRSTAYVLALGTLALVYYASAYLVSTLFIQTQASDVVSLSPINILLALLLVFIFQPIKRFFDRVTNDIFYKDNYKSEDFFASLSKLLSSTIDLRGLLERASQQMADTFKVEQAFFFLYYTNTIEHHMSAGTRGHARLPIRDARLLDTYAENNERPIILTHLIGDEEAAVRRMLVSHNIALIMPLKRAEKIIGYVMLGDRLSSSYTKRDMNVLRAISDELVIAIQNALSLHEVKELNATLQQRIDVATKELRSSNAQLKHLDEIKDEFISMASHQLRTPLTSVKGYLSMVLDGDGGDVTPKQQKLLTEAFNSSERMVRLIADFLNVSRLQSGKFIIEKQAIDLTELVKQEVSDLKLIAQMRHIKLRENIVKKPTYIYGDEPKMRQVVMNFIDNAIYYSKPGSTVVISLEHSKGEASFTVVDTGIGVPEEDQKKLFNKFFRAGNAKKQRPDGTGVGLYMARRVIQGHSGSIIFSSKEGRGSTFGFKLPYKESAGS